jgi:hypothetical protein
MNRKSWSLNTAGTVLACGAWCNACGFHDPEAVIAMIMLDRAGITPNLPWTANP